MTKMNYFRCTAFSYLEGDPELAFFAIYDGHGGTGVANYLKDHLHEFILDQPEYNEGNMHDAVVNAFLKASNQHFYCILKMLVKQPNHHLFTRAFLHAMPC